MARICSTLRERTIAYNTMAEQAKELGEDNDCTVKAVTVTTGAPYNEVHELFKKHGRQKGKGASLSIMSKVLDDLGFKADVIDPLFFIVRYPGIHNTLKNVTSHHPDRFNEVWRDGHNYIFFVSGYRHCVGIVNGVNHDWTKGRAKLCKRIWRILEK